MCGLVAQPFATGFSEALSEPVDSIGKVLKESIFNVLFADKIGKREKDIKAAETVTLVERFKDKGSGDVALIRAELQKRYTEGLDCELIAQVFSEATKKDQQWVKSRSGNK